MIARRACGKTCLFQLIDGRLRGPNSYTRRHLPKHPDMNMVPSLVAAATEIAQRRLSPVELLDGCLARIQRLDGDVRAWVVVDEEGARRTASELEEEAARGTTRGPLHGIPVGVKDIVDVAGLPCEAGSPVLRGNVARDDATLVTKLRAAGAIILGKTVTTEYACFDPPPTRNPWNLEHTPGGSSSGSAAAVATGMCLAAIGSQTGGSITRPASFCGVSGAKPTFGRVSRMGMVPVSFHLDHPGPICRQVGDLAVMLQVMAGFDSRDPASSRKPVEDYVTGLERGRPPRLGLLEKYFCDDADEAVRGVTSGAIASLRTAGANIASATLPNEFADVWIMHRRVMAVEAAAYHRRQFAARRSDYAPNLASMIEEGLSTTVTDYADALAHQMCMRRAIHSAFEGFDALLTPATKTTAPASLETTGDPAFNSPWSYTGLPIVSFPCGLAADGLPCGLQLVGRLLGEAELFSVAAWCEREIEFDRWPTMASEA